MSIAAWRTFRRFSVSSLDHDEKQLWFAANRLTEDSPVELPRIYRNPVVI
jgi:hypothetical protein